MPSIFLWSNHNIFMEEGTIVNIRIAASEQEIEQALEVYIANEPPSDSAEKASTLAHWLAMYADCPESFWIAEDEASQQIVGIASAVLRPPQWILANFYVLPSYQGKGLGRELLTRAFSTREGCERFLVHSSTHPSAHSLYMQLGMYPLPYSMMFTGYPVDPVTPLALTIEDYPVDEILSTLNAFDQRALGFTRAVYHQRWAQNGAYFLVKKGGQVVGYFRVSPEGWLEKGMIGPLVVSNERWMTAALDWAIAKQKEISTEKHEIFVPGANRAAIAYLLAHGYRTRDLNLLLSSQPMPGLARVIFHDTDIL
jgi:GNAT superfamily N-acetyltransferase